MSIQFENDHNVYILGAGFSYAAGLPLIATFMNRMRDSVPWLDANGRFAESSSIKEVLAFRLRAAAASYRTSLNPENIEELFSLASANGGESLTTHMTLAIAATLDYCSETSLSANNKHMRLVHVAPTFSRRPHWVAPTGTISQYKGLQAYSASLYEKVVGLLVGFFSPDSEGCRSSFITFNYDNVLEDALSSLGIGFHYGFKGRPSIVFDESSPATRPATVSSHTVPVYKLHGSMNWAVRPGANNQIKIFGRYGNVPKEKTPPLLIPPTWRKVFREELSDVWDGAVRALTEATRVVVIGFSLPPIDVHFKYLMAAGLQDNVSLRRCVFVDPAFEGIGSRDALEARILGVIRPELKARGLLEFLGLRVEGMDSNRNSLFGREMRNDVHV